MTLLPRRFRRNVASNYMLTAASMLVAIVTTPILVHELGKVEYGIWVLVGSLVWYLPLLEFGFGGATVKYVAEHHSRDDSERFRRTVATAFWLLCIPALLACALGVALALAFPLLFDVAPDVERAAQILVLLVSFEIACSMPMDTFGNTLVGLQRYDLLNATLVAVLLAQAVAWLIVLWAGGGLVALGVASVAISLVGQLARYVLARRLTPDVTVAPRLVDRALIRPLAGLSAWLSLATISKVVMQRVDVVVVGLVVGIPEAAVYAVGQKLAFLADQAILPITRVFFPYSSELAARSDARELGRTMFSGTRVALAVAGPLCLVLAVLATPSVRAWVGPGFDEAGLVLVFLAAATAVRAVTQTGIQMLLGTGRARVPALIAGGEAALNLTLSIVLGLTMGLAGVALATLVAAAVAQLGLVLPYVCSRFALPLRTFVGSVLRAHVPSALAGLLVAVPLTSAGVSGVVAVVAAGAAIAAAYLVSFAFTGLDAGERRRALAPLRARLFGSAGTR